MHPPADFEDSIEQAAERLVERVASHLPEPIVEPIRAGLHTPLAHRIGRFALRAMLVVYFVFALLVLALRYYVMPQIGTYRTDIERSISSALQRPVHIRELDSHWVGLRPALLIHGLTIEDATHNPALQLEQIDAQLSWSSFLFGQLRFAHLEIRSPDLALRRDNDGHLFIAGIDITPSAAHDSSAADWLLAQDRIVIRDAVLRWRDESRAAPELVVPQINLQIENSGRRHRFGIGSDSLAPIAGRLDLRGELHGRSAADIADWSGTLYLALDHAHLQSGQPWIDLPAQATAGDGSLRLWLELEDGAVRKVTTDLQLSDVHSRLGPDLPALVLRELDGRISIENHRGATTVGTHRLSLATSDGLRLAPTDLRFRLDQLAGGDTRGQGSINSADLGTLASLARHLPLPDDLAERLMRFAPKGKISDLQVGWNTRAGKLDHWNIAAGFSGLSLDALGPLPGIRNISGRVLGDQRSGRLNIVSAHAGLSLPSVFPEPNLDFDKLEAIVEWDVSKTKGEAMGINLRQASFENRDAAGSASGHWHPLPGHSAGYIDVEAKLSRAEGTAVWRYLPVSAPTTAKWLRASLLGGHASNVAMTLQGNLDEFPFRDPHSGRFEVRSQIHGARLIYGPSWPGIENIEGDLLFKGPGLLISANSATTLGAQLSEVRAEIPDLVAQEPVLDITGHASGPTKEFLRFIEASPVGESLNHFTRPMTATGAGSLDLLLSLPLNDLSTTKVKGAYNFAENSLQLDPAVPVISAVNGQLEFTENSLSASALRGTLLGGPVSATIRTDKDIIGVNVGGEISVDGLRKYPAIASVGLLDHLSGASKWSGNIRLGSKGVELALNSALVGLASDLPPPFDKSASDAIAVHFERKPPSARNKGDQVKSGAELPGTRGAGKPLAAVPEESMDFTLGKQLHLQIIRRIDEREARVVRGALAIGRSAFRLPDRDLQISVDLPAIDLDFWRRNLLPKDVTGHAVDTATPGAAIVLPPINFDFRSDKLTAFGRDFADVRITGRRLPDADGEGVTRGELRSQSFVASLEYRERDKGKLTGSVPQLTIPESSEKAPNAELDLATRRMIKQLPAIDLTVEHLGYKRQDLGRLTIAAENHAGDWDAKLSLHNSDADLEGALKWKPEESEARTVTDFHLDAKNLDKLFDRLGMPGTLKRGSAKADGKLDWQGAPTGIDYPTLTGSFSFEARDGQFDRLEPGVGRLLGILSLQSLPRRITLDFRDIFSQGFAFDRIAGSFDVKQGIMSTDNLDLQGPAAKVLMHGQIDLGQETQDLKVRVQPALGESIAVGAMLANPVVGAVAWATQKLLSDPLDKVFSYEYAITGGWSDPIVNKLGIKPVTPGSATNPNPAGGKK